jgi:transglutaminase/protease-like cytokinesis protein 3
LEQNIQSTNDDNQGEDIESQNGSSSVAESNNLQEHIDKESAEEQNNSLEMKENHCVIEKSNVQKPSVENNGIDNDASVKEPEKEVVNNSTDTSNKTDKNTLKPNNTDVQDKTAIKIKHYNIGLPESIPQGDLSDHQYTVVKEMLEILKTSNESEVIVPTLLYGDMNTARSLLDYMSQYIGTEVIFCSISRCDENGVLNWGGHEKLQHTKITLNPSATKSKIEKTINDYDVVLDAVKKAGLSDGMGRTEAINRIIKWIAKHMTYVVNGGDAYVGFTTGQGQCMTYAMMFDEMCNTVGIECEYITGTAGGYHAWNKVKLNGKWYWVDVTWYDSTGDSKYCLSETLWSSHVVEQ